MKVTHIETIVAIAEAGSLRAAARILQKSQPALTKTLKQAEEELGAKIFTRAARGVEPTEIGRKIIAGPRLISSDLLSRSQRDSTSTSDGLFGPKVRVIHRGCSWAEAGVISPWNRWAAICSRSCGC